MPRPAVVVNRSCEGAAVIDLNNAGEQRRPLPAAQRELDQRPRIESALAVLDPDCDRDTWVRIGQAIQNELGEDGFAIWDDWSRSGSSYRESSARETWRSFGQGRGITAGTLFKLAQEYGWSDTVPAREMSPEEVEVRRRSREEAARKNAEEAERVQAQARAWSAAIIATAQPARPDHPYLVRKGVYPAPSMLEIDAAELQRILGYPPQADGEPLAGRVLVIPLERFDGTGPCTVELVDESGRKAALAGRGTKTGAHGRLDGFQGVPDMVVVGEGGTTTLATLAALRGHNTAAFMTSSNSNMPTVAKAIRAQYPGARIIILADLVKATGEPDPKAVEAAQAVNGSLAVPDFGPDRKYDDKDFNDLASAPAHGLDAVYRCIEAALAAKKSKRKALRYDDLMALSDVEWIIKNIMAERSVGIVYGLSAVGKSFLMVDMAADIQEGREWFGFRTKQKQVVYACLEGQHGYKRRVQAWAQYHNRRYPGVVFSPDPMDIRTKEDTDDLSAFVLEEVGPGAVVIVDTLNRAAPGLEENGSVDYGLILASATRIAQAVEGSVCFVGHPGKNTDKGFRGHYSMFAGVDMVLEVEEANKSELLFSWNTRKVKDGRDDIVKHFRREVVELGQDADGDPVTSCVVYPDPEADSEGAKEKVKTPTITPVNRERFERFRQAAMERGFLDDSGAFIGIDRGTWREHHQENHPNPKGTNATRAAFNDAVIGLKKSLLICETADGLFQFGGPGAKTQAAIIGEAIRARRGWSE